MSQPLEITIIPDGPIKVSGCNSARFCGEPLDVDGDIYLCRCGQSSNAPFCDGSHKKVGFDGACPEGGEQEVRTWEGRTIRTFFNKTTCMHVYYCKPLADLRERELGGDDEAAEEIKRVIATCPSGALRWAPQGVDEGRPMDDGDAAIDIREGGEVRVQVPFAIDAARHDHQPENRAALCRCGRSKNKPWCDGRHKGRKDFR